MCYGGLGLTRCPCRGNDARRGGEGKWTHEGRHGFVVFAFVVMGGLRLVRNLWRLFRRSGWICCCVCPDRLETREGKKILCDCSVIENTIELCEMVVGVLKRMC